MSAVDWNDGRELNARNWFDTSPADILVNETPAKGENMIFEQGGIGDWFGDVWGKVADASDRFVDYWIDDKLTDKFPGVASQFQPYTPVDLLGTGRVDVTPASASYNGAPGTARDFGGSTLLYVGGALIAVGVLAVVLRRG